MDAEPRGDSERARDVRVSQVEVDQQHALARLDQRHRSVDRGRRAPLFARGAREQDRARARRPAARREDALTHAPVRLGRPGSELAAAGRGDGMLPVAGRHARHDRQRVVLASAGARSRCAERTRLPARRRRGRARCRRRARPAARSSAPGRTRPAAALRACRCRPSDRRRPRARAAGRCGRPGPP